MGTRSDSLFNGYEGRSNAIKSIKAQAMDVPIAIEFALGLLKVPE